MSGRVKIAGLVVLLVVTIALVLAGAWRLFSRQAFPKTSGRFEVGGLSQPVEIVRDEVGVAHIYATTAEDLFFAQGFVHAQERFWQMELQRRIGSGRMSEIVGEAALPTDLFLRHFAFHDLATRAYDLLEGESRDVVDAYTAGVNAYIADRSPPKLGLEFALLGLQGVDVEIEPWTTADSLIWGEMLIFDQSDQLRTELANIDLLAAVGQDQFSDLRTAYRDDRPVIIPTEELGNLGAVQPKRVAELEPEAVEYLQSVNDSLADQELVPALLTDLGFGLAAGSNSFVVSGDLSATGMPLLANDPHMSVNMPALWYEIGLHCSERSAECVYDLRGFSLPGVPGILIGHNDRIAWGLTNAAFDAEDVFIERLNPQNPNQYEVDGRWQDMTIRREEIVVRGWDEPEVIFVRSTRNGLIASDALVDRNLFTASGEGPELFALAYAWTALEPVGSFEAVFRVNRAQNWNEFVEALRYFDAGKQNWLYADVDGNIGYVLPGKIPIRAGGDGTIPVPGWNDDYRWTGFIPYEELPRVFNPAQGYIVTANNPQVRARDYPYLLNVFHFRGQRAQRITDMIQSDSDGITIEDMIAAQTDNQSLAALEIIPSLAQLSFDDPAITAARDRLLNWNGQMHLDSPEAALFNIFWVHLLGETLYDQLPEELYPRGDHATFDAIYWLLQEPNNAWWDDVDTAGRVEDRDAILARALEGAVAEGINHFGDDLDDWNWGNLHTITFENAILGRSGIGLIEDIFNRGPFPTNGSEAVPQKTCWSANVPYEVVCIPALRQVIDLGDLSNSRMIHSVGQSGHPGHRYYDHFVDDWRFFRYHPSNWTRAEAESGPHDLLILAPRP